MCILYPLIWIPATLRVRIQSQLSEWKFRVSRLSCMHVVEQWVEPEDNGALRRTQGEHADHAQKVFRYKRQISKHQPDRLQPCAA